MSIHDEKLKSAIIKLAAEFLNREASKQSLITVTDCEFIGDNQECVIIVSVFPPDQGKTALAFLKRKRIELRDYLRANLRAGRLPRVDFTLASGDEW
jgi:ribosome-binding factor A